MNWKNDGIWLSLFMFPIIALLVGLGMEIGDMGCFGQLVIFILIACCFKYIMKLKNDKRKMKDRK